MTKKLLFAGMLFLTFYLTAQISPVKNINLENTGETNKSSNPQQLYVFDGKLYFSAHDTNGLNSPGNANLGRELWVTDGTEAGTSLLKDINSGSSGSLPREFFTFNNTMYFTVSDADGANIWKSDGTAVGTVSAELLPNFNESAQRPITLNGKVYMTGITTAGDTNDLLVFDGTTLTNANTGTDDENILTNIVAFKNKIFCYASLASQDATIGIELYSFDTTTNMFTLVKDITGDDGNASISNFTILGNELYFEALSKLWKTDGTTAGTVAVAAADIYKGVNNLVAFNNKILFEGDVTVNGGGDNLIAYDPATNTTINISNFTGDTQNHDPSDYLEYDGFLYYRGEEATTTTGHLYRTNGVTTDLISNTIKDVDDLVLFNNKIYFEGDNGTTGNELYVLNPTTLSIEKATFNAISIYPNPSKNTINVSHNLNDKVYYSILDLNGRSVSRGTLVDNKIKHSLSTGVYLLKLESKNTTKTQKIVVE
ncbi:T9SS type A sorting domain-containing protein [Polaribacter cellanae]|uniref:T9SS type A sorting domain-containing protein n=1 Tax=Polaribacter cellanae TaxID=2818493 RepID=A0A975H610_9FLAO|nr:T9SS type A sorting domain-containing protein [Polaribacter cellanae]QTE21434.1 T9SS type A sorting domain-containing protein [Polaribacter cellanae]